jgi:hypothetical protein
LALLTEFAIEARAILRERLTIRTYRHGLRLSAVVVFIIYLFQMNAPAVIARRSVTVKAAAVRCPL